MNCLLAYGLSQSKILDRSRKAFIDRLLRFRIEVRE